MAAGDLRLSLHTVIEDKLGVQGTSTGAGAGNSIPGPMARTHKVSILYIHEFGREAYA